MNSILAISALLIVLATALPLWRQTHWLVRVLDFPRLQIGVLAAVLLSVQLFHLDLHAVGSQVLVAVTVLCLIWHLWWILPYTRLWPCEVKASTSFDPQRQLSVITANVLTPNRNSDALVAVVREHRPDILVTLESDQWWQEQLSVLETDMPYSVKCPLDNLYGMHVYSRLRFTEEEIAFLVEDDVPSIHLLLELRCGERVRMHFVHPAPPSPTENEESAERDAELILLARSIARTEQPAVVTGDLNDVAWSPTTRLFRKISGLLDPRVGRGLFNTFHAKYALFRWPLDHLFHSRHFTLRDIRRLPPFGSDHFALLTTLTLEPSRGAGQEGLADTSDDHERARRITDEKEAGVERVPEPQ